MRPLEGGEEEAGGHVMQSAEPPWSLNVPAGHGLHAVPLGPVKPGCVVGGREGGRERERERGRGREGEGEGERERGGQDSTCRS
eukprot:3137064-Rhodomonas_salina.1